MSTTPDLPGRSLRRVPSSGPGARPARRRRPRPACSSPGCKPAASSSMSPPISPISTTASVRSSRSRSSRARRVRVPSTGSPPIPMKADWPSPARTMFRQARVPRLPLRETTPTRPGRKIEGSKAGMKPTEVSPGVTRPAVLGPTISVPASRAAAITCIVSRTGTCSVRITSLGTPAATASSAAGLTLRGGTNSTETSRGTCSAASRTLPNTGTRQWVMPALRGLTPATTRVP